MPRSLIRSLAPIFWFAAIGLLKISCFAQDAAPVIVDLHIPYPGPYATLADGPQGTLVVGTGEGLGLYDGVEWRELTLPFRQWVVSCLANQDRLWIGGQGYVGWFAATGSDKTFHLTDFRQSTLVTQLLKAGANQIAVSMDSVALISAAGKVIDSVQLPGPRLRHCFAWQSGWVLTSATDAIFVRAGDRLVITDTPIPHDFIVRNRLVAAVPIDDQVFLIGATASYEFANDRMTRSPALDWRDLRAEHVIAAFDYGETPTLIRIGTDGGIKGFDPHTKSRRWVLRPGKEMRGIPISYPLVTDRGVFFSTTSGVYWMPDPSQAKQLTCTNESAIGVDRSGDGFWVSTSENSRDVASDCWQSTETVPGATWSVSQTPLGTIRGQTNAIVVNGERRWMTEGEGQVADITSSATSVVLVQGIRLVRLSSTGEPPQSVELESQPTRVTTDDSGAAIFGTERSGVYRWKTDGTLKKVEGRDNLWSTVAYAGHSLAILWGDGRLTVDSTVIQLPTQTNWIALAMSSDTVVVGGNTGRSAELMLVMRESSGKWTSRPLDHQVLASIGRLDRIALFKNRIAISASGGAFDFALSLFEQRQSAPTPSIGDPRAFASKNGVDSIRSLSERVLSLRADEDELRFTFNGGTEFWKQRVQFRYRLTPDSAAWTNLDTDDETNFQPGEITLQRIGVGRHELEIQARTLTGTSTTTYTVVRAPHWYAGPTAVSSYVLSFLAGVAGFVVWRTRRLEERARVLEQRVAERTAELKKANEAKDEFLASMSHEIRNPLNGVIGLSTMLRDSAQTDRDRHLTDSLKACADQLRLVLDDVLDFAVIERGEVQLQVAPFHPAAAVQAAVVAIDPKLERTRLKFAADFLDLLPIQGDEGKVRQIVSNLVSNALKYGIPPEADVEISYQGGTLIVKVSNTGPDIPAAEQARIFGSFERGRSSSHKYTRGAGLGLTICARFARAMGGDVTVKSKGGLTAFTFSAPMPPAEITPRARSAEATQNRGKALAIEDETYNRLVLGHVLNGLGLQVDWAQNGTEALEILRSRNQYDVIFTDWMLPDMEGTELVQKITELGHGSTAPIIAVTAYATAEKREEAFKAGVAAFVTKPILTEKIEAALRTTTETHRATFPAPAVADVGTASDEPLRIGVLLDTEFPLSRLLDFRAQLLKRMQEIERAIADENCGAGARVAHQLASQLLAIHHHTFADEVRALETALARERWDVAREIHANITTAAASLCRMLDELAFECATRTRETDVASRS